MQNAFRIILSKKAQFFATFLTHALFFKNRQKTFTRVLIFIFIYGILNVAFEAG